MGKGAVGRILVVGTVAAVAGGGGVWAGISSSTSSSAAPSGTVAPATTVTRVVRADLAAQQTIAGTVNYDGSWTVVLPSGTVASVLSQAQQKVSNDQMALGTAEQTLADVTSTDQLTISQATQSVNSAAAAHNQSAFEQATGALAMTQQHAAQAEHQAQSQVAASRGMLSTDQAALVVAQQTAVNPGTTFTALPAIGQVVQQGQPLYALDSRPVPLLYGPVAAWRAFSPGMQDGPDITELNQALVALGFATTSSGAHFSTATGVAISKLQGSFGLSQTGTLHLGDVCFEPGPFRVAGVNVHPGSPAQPGTSVLVGTSTTPVITALVPLANVATVKVGDTVTVDLPDGHNGVAGAVRDIGVTASGGGSGGGLATSPPGGASGPTGGGSNGAGSNGGAGATSEPATVTLSNPILAAGLDQAAVLVHITTQTVKDVLAVPVEALLALSDGGEGVEVVSGASHRIVAVQTGIFTGTQVQISGASITEGSQVEVPAP
jgi:membrane fusion protein, multidrug efflux system